jgi:hypothetical protein
VVKINKGVSGPEPLAQLFPGDRLPRALQQNSEDLEGLVLQFDADTALAQFSFLEIGFKYSKVEDPRIASGRCHGTASVLQGKSITPR